MPQELILAAHEFILVPHGIIIAPQELVRVPHALVLSVVGQGPGSLCFVTTEVAFGRAELSLRPTKKIKYIFYGFSMVPRPETFKKSKKRVFAIFVFS